MVGRGPGAFWFPVSLLSVLPDQAVHWGRLCVAPQALRVSRCAGGRGGCLWLACPGSLLHHPIHPQIPSCPSLKPTPIPPRPAQSNPGWGPGEEAGTQWEEAAL